MNQLKRVSKLLLVLSVSLFAFSSLHANEPVVKKHEVIKLKIADEAGTVSDLEFDSDITGIHLNELADGESRTVTTKSGETISLSRIGDELVINKNGEDIRVPLPNEVEDGMVKVMHLDGDGQSMDMDFDIDIDMPEGITISSSRVLDQATQDTIRAALLNAGIQDAIHFSDGPKIIKKAMFIGEDGERTELDLMDGDVEEFTTKDGKHIKVVKKRMHIEKETD